MARSPVALRRDEISTMRQGRWGTWWDDAMPKPPAGFFLDDRGQWPVHRCRYQAHRHPRRIDDANNRPLECIIGRVCSSTEDHECFLLCPDDCAQEHKLQRLDRC